MDNIKFIKNNLISKQAKLKNIKKEFYEIRKTEKVINQHLLKLERLINKVEIDKKSILKRKKLLEI